MVGSDPVVSHGGFEDFGKSLNRDGWVLSFLFSFINI